MRRRLLVTITLVAMGATVPAVARQEPTGPVAAGPVLDVTAPVLDLEVGIVDIGRGTTEVVSTAMVEVRLDASVFFDPDQADLRPAARATLAEVADQIVSDGAAAVTIVGHTDSTDTAAANRDLSQRRATSVADFLGGLVPDVAIEASGRGEADPIAPNETEDGDPFEEGRRLNRRVEVTYIPAPE